MNKFTFRAVGQGLFYTGSLRRGSFNFVYDCGTENSQQYINNEITNFVQDLDAVADTRTIDFVVISHLHKDHYSGLYQLLKHTRVNKIYLPYFDFSSDVLCLQLFYDIYINDTSIDNQQDKNGLYNLLCSLYFEESIMYKEYCEKVSFVGQNKTEEIFNSHPLWNFEFIYNKADDYKIASIKVECAKLLADYKCNSIKEFIEQNKDNIEIISAAYKKIFKSGDAINNTSITLLHYPKENRDFRLSFCCNGWCATKLSTHHCIGCHGNTTKYGRGSTLLTGDVKINNNLVRNLNKIIAGNNFSVLQMPHHGARKNWKSIVDNFVEAAIYVIPFGYGNKYLHPDSQLINYFMSNNKEYYCVTQNQSFVYWII